MTSFTNGMSMQRWYGRAAHCAMPHMHKLLLQGYALLQLFSDSLPGQQPPLTLAVGSPWSVGSTSHEQTAPDAQVAGGRV
jgi:hypothetical protein